MKEDVGHIFFQVLCGICVMAQCLWKSKQHTSGSVMPCAYYSPAEGFQPLAKCQCLALDRHPSRRAICLVGWEEPLTAAGDAGWEELVHTNDMLIPSRKRGVMPAVRDGDFCLAGVCKPAGSSEQFLSFCQCWPPAPKLVHTWAKRE